MNLGDACCVCLAELIAGTVVYTLVSSDFMVHRKHGRQPGPSLFPPRS